jgi:hypothetical protein
MRGPVEVLVLAGHGDELDRGVEAVNGCSATVIRPSDAAA